MTALIRRSYEKKMCRDSEFHTFCSRTHINSIHTMSEIFFFYLRPWSTSSARIVALGSSSMHPKFQQAPPYRFQVSTSAMRLIFKIAQSWNINISAPKKKLLVDFFPLYGHRFNKKCLWVSDMFLKCLQRQNNDFLNSSSSLFILFWHKSALCESTAFGAKSNWFADDLLVI